MEPAEETAQAATEESAPSTEAPDTTISEEAVPSGSAPEGSAAQTTEDKGSEPEKQDSKVVRELKDQRRKRQEAERDAAYWKGVAEGKAPKPDAEPKPDAPAGKPTIEQFDSYDEYVEALVDWKADQKAAANKAKSEEERARETYNQKKATLEERITEAAEEDPDLLTYYHDTTLPVSPIMAEVFLDSEADLQLKFIKFFGENRKEAARIAKLSPIAAVKELGKIEDKLLNPPKPEPAKKISQAPEPISTVAAKGKVVNALEDDADISDFMRARNKQQYGSKGA